MKLAKDGVPSLEFHKNLEYIAIVVSLCANKLPGHANEDEILKISIGKINYLSN